MIKTIKSSIQFYKGLQEWFDPAYEGNPYKNKYGEHASVTIKISGIATKTVYIVR